MSPFDIEKSFHYQEAKHITLTLQESTIEAFFNEFNSNHTGLVSRSTIVERLLHVYKALVPTPQQYHLLHPSRAEHLQAFLDCLFDGFEYLCSSRHGKRHITYSHLVSTTSFQMGY
jgi:hypothetical protein